MKINEISMKLHAYPININDISMNIIENSIKIHETIENQWTSMNNYGSQWKPMEITENHWWESAAWAEP